MKKFGFVSSYSESCGNASFTKLLIESVNELNIEVNAEAIPLELNLLQSANRKIRKAGNIHIDELSKAAAKFDYLNIQMEAGLYGTLPNDIINRFKKLVKSNRNVSVTLHSPRLISSSNADLRSGILKIFKLDIKNGIKEILASFLSEIHIKINRRIILESKKANARLIVHTNRSKHQIITIMNYNADLITVHPLQMVPNNHMFNNNALDKIKFEYDIKDGHKLIGMFGYISSYKGHLDALKALSLLPNNYHLMIFGRQHPQTIKNNGSVDYYLELLINTINSNPKLRSRVHFVGELNDQDFINTSAQIDCVWLPYYENGQDGSGIASICFEVSKCIICSTSFAFDELFKLNNYFNYLRFDIGNSLELAEKTKRIIRKYETEKNPVLKNSANKFSPTTQAIAYINSHRSVN
jgi:glycosyltransferase involved in cell wall biosynthesis